MNAALNVGTTPAGECAGAWIRISPESSVDLARDPRAPRPLRLHRRAQGPREPPRRRRTSPPHLRAAGAPNVVAPRETCPSGRTSRRSFSRLRGRGRLSTLFVLSTRRRRRTRTSPARDARRFSSVSTTRTRAAVRQVGNRPLPLRPTSGRLAPRRDRVRGPRLPGTGRHGARECSHAGEKVFHIVCRKASSTSRRTSCQSSRRGPARRSPRVSRSRAS